MWLAKQTAAWQRLARAVLLLTHVWARQRQWPCRPWSGGRQPRLVSRALRPALPALARSRVPRTLLMAGLRAQPWRTTEPELLALRQGFGSSPDFWQQLLWALLLDVPGWPGHRAGQHADIRLTAEDGYRAQRSYSIASAPEDDRLALTIERIDER